MKVVVAFVGVLLLTVAAAQIMLPTPAGAQPWTCEIVGATSCSDARAQCLRIIRKNMGQKADSKWCAAPHTKCLATGTWKGSVCNIGGLRKA